MPFWVVPSFKVHSEKKLPAGALRVPTEADSDGLRAHTTRPYHQVQVVPLPRGHSVAAACLPDSLPVRGQRVPASARRMPAGSSLSGRPPGVTRAHAAWLGPLATSVSARGAACGPGVSGHCTPPLRVMPLVILVLE